MNEHVVQMTCYPSLKSWHIGGTSNACRVKVPVSSMQLSQGIPGIVALPSVHPHLLGPRLEGKVAPYMSLQHIHWMIPAHKLFCHRPPIFFAGTAAGKRQTKLHTTSCNKELGAQVPTVEVVLEMSSDHAPTSVNRTLRQAMQLCI